MKENRSIKIELTPREIYSTGEYIDMQMASDLINGSVKQHVEFCYDNNIKFTKKDIHDIIELNWHVARNWFEEYKVIEE